MYYPSDIFQYVISKQILSILRAGILYYPFCKALRESVHGIFKVEKNPKEFKVMKIILKTPPSTDDYRMC